MINQADLEFVCHICNQPLKLETDLLTDEHGESVHGNCYAKFLMKQVEQGRTGQSGSQVKSAPPFAAD